MVNRLKILWLALFISITAFLLTPFIVYADTAAPNLTSINETYAWRNVITANDTFIVSRYSVDYGAIPVTDISDTFLFRFMDTTNTIELGVVEAYPYQNSGYGQGIVAWYFPASAITWGQPYWIRIQGKTTVFDSPPTYSYSIPATSYSTLTATADVKTDIANTILKMAVTIGNSWTPTQALTEQVETGTLLSKLGEAYIRSAIPGIQAMAPSMFYFQFTDPDVSKTTWSTTKETQYANKVKGTSMGDSIQGVADLFSMDFSAIIAIPIIIICIILIIIGAVHGNMLAGLCDSAFVMTAGAFAGWFPLGVLMIVSFLGGLYMLFHLIYKGTSG